MMQPCYGFDGAVAGSLTVLAVQTHRAEFCASIMGLYRRPDLGDQRGLMSASGTMRPAMQWLVGSGYLLK